MGFAMSKRYHDIVNLLQEETKRSQPSLELTSVPRFMFDTSIVQFYKISACSKVLLRLPSTILKLFLDIKSICKPGV